MAMQTNRRGFLEAIALSATDLAVLGTMNPEAAEAAAEAPAGAEQENRGSSVPVESGDAYVRFDPSKQTWSCGTGLIEQQLELAGGRFRLAKLANRLTGSEYVAGAGSDEFHFLFGGRDYSGDSGGYKLKDFQIARMPVPKVSPGIESGVTLVVNLEHPLFLVRLHYD